MENTVKFEANSMRDSSAKWNLAEDVELLKHLERFTEGFMKNASLVVKCMDNLEENLTLTYLNVRSVSNKFHSVGDTQFIENRAHDDDEPAISPSSLQEKVEVMDVSNDPPSSSDKLDESLSSCIRFLEDKFETIQLSESDSEDEGLDHSPVVLKPHKCYIDRPLPHIIGSYKFLNDSTLGLSLVLQENEDSTETEDETGNSLFSKIQQDSTEQNTGTLLYEKEEDAPSIFSKVTHDETTSSDDVLNRFMPSNKLESDSSLSLDDDNLSDEKTLQENTPNLEDNQKLLPKNTVMKSVLEEMNSRTNQQSILRSKFADNKEKIVRDLPPSAPVAEKTIIHKFPTKIKDNSSIEEDKTIKEKNFLDDFPVDEFEKTTSRIAFKSELEDIYSRPRPQKLFIKTDDVDIKKDVQDIRTSNEVQEKFVESKPFEIPSDNDSPVKKPGTNVTNRTLTPVTSEPLFDEITPTDILSNLSKDRIKVQNKRRPPSRKARIESPGTLDGNFFNSATTSNNSNKFTKIDTETIVKQTKKLENKDNLLFNSNITSATNSLISPSTDEEDLFTICTSSITSDLSSDRLFQPLPLLNESNKKVEKKTKLQTSESLWDPFSEDDSSFFTNSSWKPKKIERSKLSNLEDLPTDDRLFMKDTEHKIFSVFDDVKSRKNSSLFDEIDDYSLFASTNDKKSSSGVTSTNGGNSNTSHSSNLFTSTKKIDFLNDPLGFNQDNDD